MKKTSSLFLACLLAAAGLFYLVFILRTSFQINNQLFFTLVDDAMISMRYAQHLAHGYGLVWNIGEKPVEGFTNPGWVFFMALLHILPIPISKISLIVMLASALILLANALVVYRICRVLLPGSTYAPLLSAAITAFYFPMVFWALRGMEVGLLSLLVDLAVLWAFSRDAEQKSSSIILIGLVLALAVLVRMDALIQAALVLVYLAWRYRSRWKVLILPVLIVALLTLAVLWFQHLYFGDYLPNTYYQKLAGASLSVRLKNGILAFNQHATRDTLMLAFISLAGFLLFKDMRRPETFLLAGLFLAQCAYSIWVGGDYAEVEVDAANRFITQGMPALIILFSLTADRMLSDLLASRRANLQSRTAVQAFISLGMALAVVVVISGTAWLNWGIDNAPLLKADIRRVKLGLVLAQYTSPDATIAVHAAGQIPYYSGRRTIDLLGLNDPVIAKGPLTGPFYPGHDKWNYDYSILQLKPDLIADNWIKLGDYMKDQTAYQQLDNGIYIRKDSTLLNVAELSREYR